MTTQTSNTKQTRKSKQERKTFDFPVQAVNADGELSQVFFMACRKGVPRPTKPFTVELRATQDDAEQVFLEHNSDILRNHSKEFVATNLKGFISKMHNRMYIAVTPLGKPSVDAVAKEANSSLD